MTKRDFELLAEALSQANYDSREECAIYIARAIAKEHPRFDKDVFFQACGLDYSE